jgi:hypothetical protein
MVLKALFKSRKAVMTLTGVIVLLLTQIGLNEEMAVKIAELIMMYVGAQGVADAARDFKKG